MLSLLSMSAENINIKNRKAKFEYEFLETYVAGMQLTGTEIKSIREGKASVAEAYCFFKKNELFIKNMQITEYKDGGHYNHDPRRDRKLLLQKLELKKLQGKLKDKGLTIIPLKVFINDRGWAKIEIALAKGKKIYDKREDIKKKDIKRELDRHLKR